MDWNRVMQSSLHAMRTIFAVFLDGLTFIRLCFRPVATVVGDRAREQSTQTHA